VDASSAAASGGKYGLSKAEIRTILALKPRPLPTAGYLDDLTDIFPPDYIKDRKQQAEADTELFRKTDEESEVFRQRVIKSVRENGYFEVDDEYLVNREKANQWALEQWAKRDLGGHLIDREKANQWVLEQWAKKDLRGFQADMEADFAVPYVPDKEDAAVLELLSSDGEEDDLSDDEEDEAQGGYGAQAHKVAAAIEAN
jgi:hypothetical protein